jgi:GxxExxY protein
LVTAFSKKFILQRFLIELKKLGIEAVSQSAIQVYYSGSIIGEYFADIIVENSVIVEVKAAKGLAIEHEAQLLNYLKATNLEVGLLLNFGPKPEVKRMAFKNSRK